VQPTLIMRDASGFVGHIGDVFLQHYSVPAPVAMMKARHAHEVAFMEKHKERKYCVVTVVLEPAITRLESDVRELQTEHTRVTAPHTSPMTRADVQRAYDELLRAT
jgi:hypothetical protein